MCSYDNNIIADLNGVLPSGNTDLAAAGQTADQQIMLKFQIGQRNTYYR